MRRFRAEQLRQHDEPAAPIRSWSTQLVDALLTAENPILITGYAGRTPRRLRADRASWPSSPASRCSKPTWSTTSRTKARASSASSPTSICRRPTSACWSTSTCRGSRATCKANESTFWAQIDVDVLKPASPMWTLPGQSAHAGQQRAHPRAAARRAEAEGDAGVQAGGGGARRARLAERARRTPRSRQEARRRAGQAGRDQLRTICSPSSTRRIEPEDIVFNEGVAQSPALHCSRSARPLPGTMMRVGGGGLGSSGGMALGAKLAAPDRMMVQIVGDGSFYFDIPCSVFAVAQQYKLPILSIVLDNSRLVGGEGIDAAGLSRRRRQGAERVRGRAHAQTSSSARSARRSAPMRRRSPIRPTCRPRSRAASRRCAAAARRSCMRA